MRLLTAVLLLLLTACAATDGGSGEGGGTAEGGGATDGAEPGGATGTDVGSTTEGTTASSQPTGSPPLAVPFEEDLPPAMRPNTVTPDPQAVDLQPLPWSRVTEPQAGTLAVHFTAGVPPCSVLADVDVDEDDDAVTVTLSEGRLPDADCDEVTLVATENVVTVELASPLGDRPVRDGAR